MKFSNLKYKLNFQKKDRINSNVNVKNDIESNNSIIMNRIMKASKQASMRCESSDGLGDLTIKAFSNMGVITNDINIVNDNIFSQQPIIERVELYLKRFPEMDYIIDMIAASVIYSSSSNTRKIQCIIRGEYDRNLNNDSTIFENYQSVSIDSYQDDLNLEIGNLFKENNVKLSLFLFIKSIIKYGCGIFYINDTNSYSDVEFFSLNELEFEVNKSNDKSNSIFEREGSLFSADKVNKDVKLLSTKDDIIIRLKKDGTELNRDRLFFISDKGTIGQSKIMKVIHYLKTIELIELSLLIERLSKSKNTFVQKLDVSNIDEEDVAAHMMMYKNLLQSKVVVNYDDDKNNVNFDFIKNLVDNNILAPTEGDNLTIDSLKSDFKPLLDDLDLYQDKVYLSMGVPSYYRNSDSRTYTNNSMLIMHDNVYSMNIRHYQLVVNNLLTYQVEKWIIKNFSNINIKYININIPEFIPLNERKDTDIDKAAKYITTLSLLKDTLGIDLKKEFILNKLFPNDIMSDIVNYPDNGDNLNDSYEKVQNIKESFDIRKKKNKYNLILNINW